MRRRSVTQPRISPGSAPAGQGRALTVMSSVRSVARFSLRRFRASMLLKPLLEHEPCAAVVSRLCEDARRTFSGTHALRLGGEGTAGASRREGPTDQVPTSRCPPVAHLSEKRGTSI